MGDDAGGMETHVMKATFDAGADADRTFHAGDIARQHVGAAGALGFGHPKCRRQAGYRRVNDCT